MIFSLFSYLFKKQNSTLHVPDSILVKKLKSLSKHSNIQVYSDVTIYHHSIAYKVPLIVLDPLRGLYLFEIKAWSYDDLKNSQIRKAHNQESSKKTLSFEKTHEIIRKRFNELLHNDGVPIFNYLIMENLSSNEYAHLSDSFKELLPFEKLIFNDSNDSDIFKKLQEASVESATLPSAHTILSTLFVQYAILDGNKTHVATQEQIDFIHKELTSKSELLGLPQSGKSATLLLKALFYLLENPKVSIVIIKPTTLACNIFKKRLLDLTEYAIVDVNIGSIDVITPLELLNRHRKKMHKETYISLGFVDYKQMHKSFKLADIVLCDDGQLYNDDFLEYLSFIQKNRKLLIAKSIHQPNKLTLTKNFLNKEKSLEFIHTNPYAKTLQLLHKLTQNTKNESILIIAQETTLNNLLEEDLEHFLGVNIAKIDAQKSLIEQDFTQIGIGSYEDINALSVKHIIMLDLCFTPYSHIEYALNIATQSVYILYEEECPQILELKDSYESSQEQRRVEESTLS